MDTSANPPSGPVVDLVGYLANPTSENAAVLRDGMNNAITLGFGMVVQASFRPGDDRGSATWNTFLPKLKRCVE